jgi:pimeloyl-ACP methyl ester carboxylesterase
VFVHGITGNRETTWTCKDTRFFWPEQLAKDVKTARIMTFGYDADVVKIWSTVGGNNLRNHGKNLASDVSDQRRGHRERPIIFIAHSLGGLVCEQALLYCREGDEFLEKVFRSTRGIIFMGTPHAGADLANWGYTLIKFLGKVRNTNSDTVEPLRRKSQALTAVQHQFQQLLLKPEVNIKIYCFFEEKPFPGVGLIVSEDSATLSQYSNQSIAADHSDMTKFSGWDDVGYQKLLGRVQDNIEAMEPPKIRM